MQHVKNNENLIILTGTLINETGKYIYIYKTQIDVQSQIDVQFSNRRPIFSNIWPFLTFSNRRPMTTSLTYTSTDVTPVKAGYWSNNREGTRPDCRWGVLDDKNGYGVFFIVTVDKIYCVYMGPISIYDTILIILKNAVCRFCFNFLSGIQLLKPENEYYSKSL